MLSEREVAAAVGSTAYGTNGDKIGTVQSFFADDRTGDPTWVAVRTGLFGTSHSIVPAADATFEDGRLRLPVTADAVKSAPHLAGDHLDPAEEAQLRSHYRIAGPAAGGLPPVPDAPPVVTGPPSDGTNPLAGTDPPAVLQTPTAGRHRQPEDDGGAMTRSEEQLRVGTERVPSTRVRLVKFVVTEEVQITVPIRREEIRVEEIPLDAPDPGPGESLTPAANPAATPSGGSSLPDEIVLHTERPVVTVEVVPTERVHLRTELVQGQETVTGQVQRERIVVEETPVPGVNPR
jgi:stress response protein YsnF